MTERGQTLGARAVRAALRPLAPDAGKEARGRVLIIGGSLRYPGALLIAARAAGRCGAGVVSAATAHTVAEQLAGRDPHLTFYPLAEAAPGTVAVAAAAQVTTALRDKIRALLVGPGFAHGTGTDEFIGAVLRNARAVPTVVDADGLNALARTERWPSSLPTRCVLTPHDGEAARLAGRVVPAGAAARIGFAERAARDWGCIVVLKGALTVVTDGKKTYVHDVPNAALGVGGSGDALAGAIAAFLARGLAPVMAAAVAVWTHGRAGALLAAEVGETGVLAMDIVDAMPRALREVIEAR